MKAVFWISSGRWSAVVSKIEPEPIGHPHPLFVVEISCDDEQANRFVFCPVERLPDNEWVQVGHGLSRFRLSFVDVLDYINLDRVTDDLCQSLHEGESVERWCAAQGLRPLREKKVRRRPNRPSPVLIRTEKWKYLLPARFSEEKEPLRGGI